MKILSTLLSASILQLSCSNAKSDAEEVCNCFKKIGHHNSQGKIKISDEIVDCMSLSSELRSKYSGDDLKTFDEILTNCSKTK